jgi:hypothetical protein
MEREKQDSTKKQKEECSIIPIKDLEDKIEKELAPAAFGIIDRIEKAGKEYLRSREEQFIKENCPLQECVVFIGNPEKCPNPFCWIAEGPTWSEFLTPEMNAVYSLLMDTYIEALNIPEDPDKKVTIKESPLAVMERKLKTEETQNLLVGLFEKAEILKPRISIIKDIVQAHNSGQYTLSVPCLIIQIEGILHDLSHHFKWEFKQKEMYRGESAKVWAVIQKLDDNPFQNALTDFYARKSLDEEAPRNLIIHGRSVNYAEDHRLSTVLFLVLVYLVAFFLSNIEAAQ